MVDIITVQYLFCQVVLRAVILYRDAREAEVMHKRYCICDLFFVSYMFFLCTEENFIGHS